MLLYHRASGTTSLEYNANTRKFFKKKHTCGLLFAKLGYTF